MNFETSSLLVNTIPTQPQATATNVKYPCTGFCYMIIQNKEKILDMYLNKKVVDYGHFISNLIREAGDRKKNNPNISEEGEFLNQQTVTNDFGNITEKMEFFRGSGVCHQAQ